MAIQSSYYITDGTTRTYPSSKHIASKLHVAVYFQTALTSAWSIVESSQYEVVNNSVVFYTAPVETVYSQIEIRVADTTAELEDSPSDIAIVAGAITDVINVSNSISVVENVNNNMGAITTVSANTTNLNSIVDNVIPNLPEILLADDNTAIATVKASEASASATLAQEYAESIVPGSLVKNVDTIADLSTINPTTIGVDNVFVKDFDRGGLFVWSLTGTANGGTVFAGSTGYWNRQYSGAINPKWFGVSTALADNGAIINSIIEYAATLSRGVTIEYDEGVFNITTPINQQYSYIKHIGKGVLKTIFQTTTNITTMVIGSNPINSLSNVDVIDIGFYHTGAVIKTNPHLVTLGAQQSVFTNWFSGGHYGHVVYGGQGITFDRTFANGSFSTQGSKSAIYLRAASEASGYTVGTSPDLPTEVNFNSIYVNGQEMDGYENGVLIEAGEHISFTGDFYIGQSTGSNVFINQTTSNKLILEVKFDRGGYIDAATVAGIRISGATGDGSQYIGSVSIDCDIKGQSGDGGRGILVDGTVRAGAFPQALQNLSITSHVSGHSGNGIEILGGKNISITGVKSWGNSFNTINNGSGIYIGAGVDTCNIYGGHIGGGTFGNGTGNQTSGVFIHANALNVRLNSVDLTGNQTALSWTPNAQTSNNRIINCAGYNGNLPVIAPAMPASAVDFYNPYGTPASVLIYGGTVTSIKLNGTQMFGTTVNAPITVNPGDRLNITYSASPSWSWWRH